LMCGLEMENGTIEAFIRRFREQPPAPPGERYIPSNAEFWWHGEHSKYQDENEKSDFFSPVSSRSSDSGRRSQRYLNHHDHDSDEDIDDQDALGRTQQSSATDGFDDFEKRTESLMKKCDNLLSDNHSLGPNQELKIPESIPKPNKTAMNGADSEEFPPWISVDLPSPLKPPEEYSSGLSPIKSSSPPPIEERNSPDSMEPHGVQSQEEDDNEEVDEDEEENSHSSRESHDLSDVPDTESDVSDGDLEETSVETTDELIKRAEQLLNGYSAPEQPLSQPFSVELVDSMASTDPLLLPSPSIEIPTPESPPSRPFHSSETAAEQTTSAAPSPRIEPKTSSCNEIGVQTDFISLDNTSPVVNTSLMSSMTTTLFISPSSTPRHSPFSESNALAPTSAEDALEITPGDPLVLLPPVDETPPPPLPPPQLEPNPSSSNPLLTLSTASPNLSETLSNLRYEDIEPFLSDEITASLWNRLVIVREQMKRMKQKTKRK
jgi:hypothetical protein